MADFLDEKRQEIGARLKELKPLVEEHERLQAAAAALAGVPASAAASRIPSARVAKAPAKRRAAKTGSGGRGRPKGTGKRSAQALALVQKSPGITIPELADKMGIKQNYLYRVLPSLAEDGLVKKDGRGWHATHAA